MQLIHPDIHYVIPTVSKDGKSQASSAFYGPWREMVRDYAHFTLNDWMTRIGSASRQANIPKDSLMELLKNFSLKIFEGHKKVGIIWHSELMMGEGNRLLKMIEEPPANSVFILLAEDTEKVLNTILSRCQHIHIPPFADEDLMGFGRRHFPIEEQRLRQFVQVAKGSLSELTIMAEQANSDLYDQFFDWLRIAYKGKALELVRWTEEFSGLSKNDQKYFYKYALNFFEQFILSYSLKPDGLRISESAYNTLQKMKGILDMEKSMQISEMLNDCIIHIERNANVKLQMMNSSLTLHRIMTGP